jgi:calcineurin-like phosphoesterase family protein
MNITDKIKKVRLNGGEVYIFSDLHILKRDKNTPRITKRWRVLENAQEEMSWVTENDLIIFLGDLVDDTIPDGRTIGLIRALFPKDVEKIWVRGNNDMIADNMLELEGFSVCYAAIAKVDDRVFIFSHTSIEVTEFDNLYNIHGHMHRNDDSTMLYYHDPTRCINVAPVCSLGKCYRLDWIIENCIEPDYPSWMDNEWEDGKEKPGMSRFIKNMAMAEYNEIYEIINGGNDK